MAQQVAPPARYFVAGVFVAVFHRACALLVIAPLVALFIPAYPQWEP